MSKPRATDNEPAGYDPRGWYTLDEVNAYRDGYDDAMEKVAAERASGGREPPGEWLRRVWDGPEPSLEDFRRNPDAVYEWFATNRASGGLDVERLAEWLHHKREAQGIPCFHNNQYLRSWDCGRDAIEAAEYARLTGGQDDE